MDEAAASAALKLHLNELRKTYNFQGTTETVPSTCPHSCSSVAAMKLIIVNLINKHKDQG